MNTKQGTLCWPNTAFELTSDTTHRFDGINTVYQTLLLAFRMESELKLKRFDLLVHVKPQQDFAALLFLNSFHELTPLGLDLQSVFVRKFLIGKRSDRNFQ